MDNILSKLVIGKPVLNKQPKNAWRLHVRVMHGDADHYDTRITDFYKQPTPKTYEEPEANLELYLQMLVAFFKLSWNAGSDMDVVREAIEKVGKWLKPHDEYFTDLWQELVGSDITTDHQFWARPEKAWITYFDENSIEHEVKIPSNVKMIRR